MMATIKENIQELVKIQTELVGKTNLVDEFLKSVVDGLDDLENEHKEKISDLKRSIIQKDKEIEELKDEINNQDSYIDVQDCEKVNTALGVINIHNQSGNLKLQEEIDTFVEMIKSKYN